MTDADRFDCIVTGCRQESSRLRYGRARIAGFWERGARRAGMARDGVGRIKTAGLAWCRPRALARCQPARIRVGRWPRRTLLVTGRMDRPVVRR
jgi:hypothetical protein